ncbi:acetyltransferase [Massilia niabensis]|uniref:Acetyltransferase n=1 Tax=Massilia niabensis TaxID=544910 RepID=A0ABW0L7A1_9BURK
MMSEPGTILALLGASGHGKVVADAALCSGWREVVFFDDAWPAVVMNGPWPVAGNTAALLACLREFDGVAVSIGNAAVRCLKQSELADAGAKLATIIHPRACVSQFARICEGSVVMAGAVVNADASIGKACIINTGATVDHDCRLADGAHISPGAHLAGNVTVGVNSWVGIGATVRQGICIGDGAMVGAGAVVVKPVADRATVVGNPAAPLAKK